ncbi:MAG: hypothetical protein KKG47_09655 [Proteobacteria bacterium]|nr:hypothetical protein [Pseudomonadota bacterium]MBU1736538.1 hypothetical protein [Pseudomonadota bacterium]
MNTPDSLDIQEAGQVLQNLTAGGSLPVSPSRLANQAAQAYLASTTYDRPGEPVFLDLLCTLAIADSRTVSETAVTSLYRNLIEGFCDDFSDSGTRNANRALAHLISFTRRISPNGTMDRLLNEIGLHSGNDLLQRWQKITPPAFIPARLQKTVRRIVIPSRVSAGADIVITSILARRLLAFFPEAEITLIGPGHLGEIFSAIPRINHHLFEVRRHGSLMDRILFWPRLIESVRNITSGLGPDEAMIFDPDSRLSQLGLVPLSAEFRTCHFPSRSMKSGSRKGSLSAITNQWLDLLLGKGPHLSPAVSPGREKISAADSFLATLRNNGCKHILIANFGVGGDERKQVADPFEERILDRLLTRENCIIILDMGCGSEEKSRTEKLLAKASHAGYAIARTNDREMAGFNPEFKHGIIGACTSLGSLAALIAGADCYLGYDSSGQHLATAVSTPSVTVFAGYRNSRFLERWSPPEGGRNLVIPVPDPPPKFLADIDGLADKTAETINNHL